jgi:hypothetical protein
MNSNHRPNLGPSMMQLTSASNLPRRVFLRASALAVASAGIGLVTGCGSTKIQNQDSVGQQLLDLEKSYKDGVITEREYNRLKKAIINKND